ncbi:MAG: LysR family transcriptional regulator [Clostridiales Family XIII bacterium]|jgi:DNA-binding transcriptional LysR family regulator|nr:LysR family transcriptional regulator [Clostridiales Family XIII bacterium]
MLNEVSIRCFLSVAKHQSFTKAAEEVFMSRQAVSKKILSLEERLGTTLFDRTTNMIELTVEGKLYLDFFNNAAQDFEALAEAIGNTGAPAVPLLIGYELGLIIDKKVIENVGAFKSQRVNTEPQIKRYDPKIIENKLLNGELNIAFTTIPAHSKIYKDFPYIILEYAEYVLVTSTNHPKVNEHTRLCDFNKQKAVYWNMEHEDDNACRKHFTAAWSDLGITVIPSIQCSSISSAYTELLFGNAIILCSTKNELCTLPGIITYPLPKTEIFGCIWSPGASPDIKAFAETFRQYEISPRSPNLHSE